MKPYTKDNAVGVGFQVRKHGVDGRRRERGRNTRILKSVLFTLDTDSTLQKERDSVDVLMSAGAEVLRPQGALWADRNPPRRLRCYLANAG